MVLLERKVIAWAQSRLGPMRVGPYGILQPIADVVKLMHQGRHHAGPRRQVGVHGGADHLDGAGAHRLRGDSVRARRCSLFGRQVSLYITDVNVGLLYIVSVASIGVYGIILAGYASNSKYPLLASLRASAQLISYEVAVTLTLVSVILMAGSLSMVSIVDAQESAGVWFAFVQPVAFVHLLHRRPRRDQPRAVRPAGSGAGADRRVPHRVQRHAVRAVLPRRIREHDRRLVGGDDAVPRRVAAAVPERGVRSAFLGFVPSWIWFLIKSFVFLYIFIWVRATLPRYRYDQLMRLGWKVLIPLAIANLVVTGDREGDVCC